MRISLEGDIGPADALLLNPKFWLSSQQRIDTINTVIVSLYRIRPPQEVLRYIEDGVNELPPLCLSSFRGGPAMKALSKLFHAGSLDSLIPKRTVGLHPAVLLVIRILLGRRDVSGPVPQRWVKEVIKAVMLRPEEVDEKAIRGTYVYGAYPSHQYDAIPAPDWQCQALRIEALEELLALYEGRDAFWYSANLYLASIIGDTHATEDYFNHFARMAPPGYRQFNSLLIAYANARDIRGLTKAFDRLFPPRRAFLRPKIFVQHSMLSSAPLDRNMKPCNTGRKGSAK